ncbi:YncE family protein [Taibaiella chishuiensis]|uniref:DNA-binding beta-propeller fold protein YncE n=1 Tax=Taibaiella chishuiensis TaxID=1434707 RepID=A0A2P8CZN0_9BACT|nr:YncE family protein [Taibaiella chishuiensis]PSK90423.1 DNA-binding beta-propeller fold protein YncE [Taibaiella chishuiensis]
MTIKVFIATTCLALNAIASGAQTQKQVKTAFPLSGDGKWDYITAWNQYLFVSHGTFVHVLDQRSGRELTQIKGLSGVHGIAIDARNQKGYISNGKMNNVVVFDLKKFEVLSTIATEQNPDFITFDPFSQTILAGNGKSNSISIIDAATMSIKGTLALDGKPEAIVSDFAGKVYVNLEDKNAIAIIDIQKQQQEGIIDISATGEEPAGLAIDRAHHLAFAGCGNEQLLIVDLDKKKVMDHIKIGAGCDAVAYNTKTRTIYASNGKDGTLSVITGDAALHFSTVQTLKTEPGAKTLALDEATDKLYLPVARRSEKKGADGKPVFDPGSFKVLVVE